MIEIKDDDLPITVAQKIIAGTKLVALSPMMKAAAKALTGIEHDGTTDMFSLDEIEEIADYLKTYVEHHKNGD